MAQGSSSPLPIFGIRDRVVAAFSVGSFRRTIIAAETGSGKSTQIPQMVLDGGCLQENERILVLEPRRIAARMLARRVAQERGSALGAEVGFRMRHAQAVSAATRVEFVTEGMLTQRILNDPELTGIGAVIFDEFHERSIQADVALSLVLHSQSSLREDLRVGVMSATLDVERLSEYLGACEVLQCSGRTFPVDIRFSAQPRKADGKPVWERAALHVAELFRQQPNGSCLVFMPGIFEINKTLDALNASSVLRGIEKFALHGDMPPDSQDRVLAESGSPKVIVSTNVAETSLTIPGVTKVVDSGLARKLRYDPHRGINTLYVEPVSRASADQRAGRAGRIAPGLCVRMWSAAEHGNRAANEDPEILRIDLSETLLSVAAAEGVTWEALNWLDAPDALRLDHARRVLELVGAVDASEKLTSLGKRIALMPVHPRYASALIAAESSANIDAVCVLVALMQERDVIMPLRDSRKEKARSAWWEHADESDCSDLIKYLAVWDRASSERFDTRFCREWGIHAVALRQAAQTARQLRQQLSKEARDPEDESLIDVLTRVFLAGFPDQVCRRIDRGTLRAEMVGGRRGDIRRSSSVRHAPLFIALEVDERTAKGGVKTYLDKLIALDPRQLKRAYPQWISTRNTVAFDKARQALEAAQQTLFLDLVIEESAGGEVDPSTAAEFCASKVLAGEWSLKAWDATVERWIARVNCLSQWGHDSEFQAIDEEGRRMMLEEICYGARREKDLAGREVWSVVKAWLPDLLHPLLDHLAPDEFQLPRRKKPAKLRYEPEHARVILPVTVQELYDVDPQLLRICEGKVQITLEILAPNRRPVQLTNDLGAFWQGSYPQVRKDLAGRYPKHEWR